MHSREKVLVGIFPGTFDPPSLGHLDIIQRAAKICSKLYVAVAVNSGKSTSLFSTKEKLSLLKKLTQKMPHVELISLEGLVIDFVQKKKIDVIIRSLRTTIDHEFELEMSYANRLVGKAETLFLMSDPSLLHIRSSLIRELAQARKPLNAFVPPEVEEALKRKLVAK